MKRLFVALAICTGAHAAGLPVGAMPEPNLPVTIDLQSVSLTEVLHLVFREIDPLSYVLAPELVADRRPVSLRWSGMSRDVRSFVSAWLDGLGYSTETKAKTLFIAKQSNEPARPIEPELVDLIYWPKYQSASSLRELASTIVQSSGFAGHRGVAPVGGPGTSAPVQPVGAGGHQSSNSVQRPPQAQQGTALAQIDKDDRMLVYRGLVKDRDRLDKFLNLVDVPTPSVIVQGAIFEVATTKHTGSAFTLAANILAGQLGAVLGPQALPNQLRLSVGGLDAVFSMLASDSRFKVLSAPRMTVRSGGQARLTVGQDVPTAGAVTTNGNGGFTRSVDYKTSGVIFDLAPHVLQNNVRLTLSQQVSSFVKTDTGVNDSPTLLKREAKTELDVTSGEVVVIGGLVDSKESTTASGLPFLPSWLGSNVEEKSGSELLILLQVTRSQSL